MKKLTLLFIFLFSSCATTNKMMIIDSSNYLEGCVTGAYSLATAIKMELNPIRVSTICQQLYLESLKQKNPEYEQIELKDQ